ncbi:hypothetical protein VIS19158_05473 [Vibrio scophthalmi LMG 19158]|uniref:Uncharacterized protein n=1 Tax=Vibrio scophthalmi LMG 19158 TaxID=870967 RepID=F9RLI9_9VIBR|nr:hypothetical protein VIS19158_05473 [Vibrio scophthalmi LMG 19158]
MYSYQVVVTYPLGYEYLDHRLGYALVGRTLNPYLVALG